MTTICVHGLGYVGLPTAALFANEGFDVVGVDTDGDRLAALERGDTSFDEAELADFVERAIESGSLSLQQTPAAADYHLVCVPTPYDSDRDEADLSCVEAAADAISTTLRPDDTVVLESTVPPGTTTGLVKDRLEAHGLVAGSDFDLAYCPETVLPGAILTELRQNDRIVAGINPGATDVAASLFESVTDGTIHRAPDPTTAEFVKLTQNTFRDTNIALANELAKIARDYGVDARDAFELANTHPRVSVLRPGPGVGGHCLPVDPYYLGQDSDSVDLIEHAREVNDGMVAYVRDLLEEQLGTLADERIAVFGIAYKGNVADTRNSPASRFVAQLAQAKPLVGAAGGGGSVDVRVHDPHVDGVEHGCSYERALADADALVIMTDHGEFGELEPADIAARLRGDLVIDTTGVIDPEAWMAHGLTVYQL